MKIWLTPRPAGKIPYPLVPPDERIASRYSETKCDEHHSMPENPIADPLAWRAVTAPSLADFEILATEVYRGLPTKFRTLCEDLAIRIEDFATDEVLDDMNIDDPFDLLGLFQGVGLPFRAESAPTHMPNMIWLYRRPILDYWSDHEESLGAVVAHVLVHEIGHHFGLSDDDMEAIEAGAD
jgi:predicted Zn-dependent protease with MMP-like domain